MSILRETINFFREITTPQHMVNYYFVMVPRGVRISEARQQIKDAVECEIKNACRGGFFVKTEVEGMGKAADLEFDGQKLKIETSQKANDETWDTLRNPRLLRRRSSYPRRTEGQIVRKMDGERKPREQREPR